MHISTKIRREKKYGKTWRESAALSLRVFEGHFRVCRSIQNSRGSWPFLLHLEPTLPGCPSTGERAPKPRFNRLMVLSKDGELWGIEDLRSFCPVRGVGQLTFPRDLNCSFRVSDVDLELWKCFFEWLERHVCESLLLPFVGYVYLSDERFWVGKKRISVQWFLALFEVLIYFCIFCVWNLFRVEISI